tara:strand:+ start:2508 stop:4820 length:2313 start_codon:yes stop_codon:yes gene_type:complete
MVDIDRTIDLGRLLDWVAKDVKLTKSGDRHEGLCPFHSEKTPSFGIFTGKDGKERFHCFGCGASGDVLDYVMERYGVDFKEAGRVISGETDAKGKPLEPKPREKPHDPYAGVTPITPPPKGTKPIKPGEPIEIWNPKRGRYSRYQPEATYLYRNDKQPYGYVVRQQIQRGEKTTKITPQVMWCKIKGKPDGWSHYTFPEERPLYRGEEIRRKRQLVVVEGEKTADAARELLDMVVITWPGGTENVDKADWSKLKGLDVIIVPDADDPGRTAAGEIAVICQQVGAKRIRIVDVEGQPHQWDLANAVEEGWTKKQAIAWLKKRATVWEPPEAEVADPFEETTTPVESGPQLPDNFDWRDEVLFNADGKPRAKSQQNYLTFLRYHDDLAGMFAFNQFSLDIAMLRCPPWEDEKTYVPRALGDADITFCQAHLERFGLSPTYDSTRKAIFAAASKLSFHPAREFFDRLRGEWDGEKRLDKWLCYYMGAELNDYTALIGRKWLIAAVRRVFQPGAKFDSMLILEGPQNVGKSLALRELATFNGVAYFTDAIEDISRKEASMKMQGVFIVEIAELDALSKAEITKIKAWITRQEDQYRPPYAASILKAPRQCVLAGTVNPEGGYLKDSTGNRRFWPVWCDSVDLEAIARDREQLWAEAVEAHYAKEPIYLMGNEIAVAKEAQAKRYQDDPWADDIDQYIHGQGRVTVAGIMKSGLEIPKAQINVLSERRVVRHLTQRGWQRKQVPLHQGSSRMVWVYLPPLDAPSDLFPQEDIPDV